MSLVISGGDYRVAGPRHQGRTSEIVCVSVADPQRECRNFETRVTATNKNPDIVDTRTCFVCGRLCVCVVCLFAHVLVCIHASERLCVHRMRRECASLLPCSVTWYTTILFFCKPTFSLSCRNPRKFAFLTRTCTRKLWTLSGASSTTSSISESLFR